MATRKGFRSDPLGGVAAPPYTKGPYTFSEDIEFNGLFRKMPERYYLEEFFSQAPALNGDILSATPSVAVPVNRHFEILGTNMTSALVTFHTTNGGILLTTAGADNDQAILLPHLDTKQTAWTNIKWGTENQTEWECAFKTGAAIATMQIWAGLKLTNTPVIATDNDQVMFRYNTTDNTVAVWHVISSIGGTDTDTTTAVVIAANTQYRFRISIDSDRRASCYINGVLVYKTAALSNDVDLIPYVGIHALTGAAVTGIVNYEKISRILFE